MPLSDGTILTLFHYKYYKLQILILFQKWNRVFQVITSI